MTPVILRDIHVYTKDVTSWLEEQERHTEAKTLILSFIFIKKRFEKNRYNSNAVHGHVQKLVQYLEEKENYQAAESLLKQFCVFNEAWNLKHVMFADTQLTAPAVAYA